MGVDILSIDGFECVLNFERCTLGDRLINIRDRRRTSWRGGYSGFGVGTLLDGSHLWVRRLILHSLRVQHES